MANFFIGFLKALKLPLKLFRRRKNPKKNELERKQQDYIYNFSPSRLKNRTWQTSLGKGGVKKAKKSKLTRKKVG